MGGENGRVTWPVERRENGLEVVSLVEREWSCYRGCQLN